MPDVLRRGPRRHCPECGVVIERDLNGRVLRAKRRQVIVYTARSNHSLATAIPGPGRADVHRPVSSPYDLTQLEATGAYTKGAAA